MEMVKDKGFKGCPILGVGMGLRRPILEETLTANDILNWVEIAPENFMGKGGQSAQMLEQAIEKYPIITHGVSMSLGSTDPWDETYLYQLKKLFQIIDPPWFSDHLCYSGIASSYFNDLIPLPRTREAIDHVVKRIQFVQETFERPYLIENISFYLNYPQNEADLSEENFLTEILERSDCGLLLDVNNIYVNALNHNWDPMDFLNKVPLERVVQIHVAGHDRFPEGIIDTHGSDVCEGVWDLLDWVLQRCKPCGVMLERDNNIPPFEELKPEILRIKALWEKTQTLQPQREVEVASCN
jgi:uncharacterized protein (UPF0276 family)